MTEMSFRCGIDLEMGVRPACMAASPEILTYRYPDGFKTGIDRERLVSIGRLWYRFLKCLLSPDFSTSTCEKFKIYVQICRFMSNMSMDVDSGQCGKTLIADAGWYGC